MSYQAGYNDGWSRAQGSAAIRSAATRGTSDAQRADEWMAYAQELERKLAQAQAETLAARIQRNAYRNEAIKLSGMDEMSYRKKLSKEVIRPEMARNGLRVDADGNVFRTR